MVEFRDNAAAFEALVRQHCAPEVACQIMSDLRQLLASVCVAGDEAVLAHLLAAAGGCGPRAFTDTRGLDTFQVLSQAAEFAGDAVSSVAAERSPIVDVAPGGVLDLRPWTRRKASAPQCRSTIES